MGTMSKIRFLFPEKLFLLELYILANKYYFWINFNF